MGDGGGSDGGSAMMSDGKSACVGSGGVNERDCCRLSRVIRELWEHLPYSFPFILEFLLNEVGDGGVAWVFDVSWVKLKRFILFISSLLSISKVCDYGRYLKE